MESLEEKKEEAKNFLEKLKIKMEDKACEERRKKNIENDVRFVLFILFKYYNKKNRIIM